MKSLLVIGTTSALLVLSLLAVAGIAHVGGGFGHSAVAEATHATTITLTCSSGTNVTGVIQHDTYDGGSHSAWFKVRDWYTGNYHSFYWTFGGDGDRTKRSIYSKMDYYSSTSNTIHFWWDQVSPTYNHGVTVSCT